MSEKRLSEGGDKVVLTDAAKARKSLRGRGKQLPVLLIFLVLAFCGAIYRFYIMK